MVTYGMEELGFLRIVEELSGVAPKDLIVSPERAIFIIPEGSIARCIGKGGFVVKKIETLMKRKIKFIEYSTDIQTFIKNVVHPLQLTGIEQQDAVVIMHADHHTRGLLIGRAAQNLRMTELIVKRFFPIAELKVE
jgi:NusA-like KH domain protein